MQSFLKYIQRRTYDYLNTTLGFTLFLFFSYFILLSLISTLASNKRLRGVSTTYLNPYNNIAFQNLYEELLHEPIDVVYTWVNGSDPIWKHKKDKWAKLYMKRDESINNNIDHINLNISNTSNTINQTYHVMTNDTNVFVNSTIEKEDIDDTMSVNRYRDSSELRYSLRSLVKNAPWIRHIYIVTDNQIPNWINLETSRLTIIPHTQIFANKSHLPVFSSPAIEANLHRIPGLSKKFIYFNDDVFLGTKVLPEDFITRKGAQKLVMSWDVPKCAPGCSDSWIGDGYCDKACNVSSCNYDYPDCINGTGSNNHNNNHGKNNNAQKFCSVGCPDSWLGDRICDLRCKNEECAWDMADCGIDLVTLGYPSATISEENTIITKTIVDVAIVPTLIENQIELNHTIILQSQNDSSDIGNHFIENSNNITSYHVINLKNTNESEAISTEEDVFDLSIKEDMKLINEFNNRGHIGDYDYYMDNIADMNSNYNEIALIVEFGTKAAYLPCMYYQYDVEVDSQDPTTNSTSSTLTCKVDHISNIQFNYEESSHNDEDKNIIQNAIIIRKHHILIATLYHGVEDTPKPYYFPTDVYFTIKGKYTTKSNDRVYHFEASFTLRVIDPMDYSSFSYLESMLIPIHMNKIVDPFIHICDRNTSIKLNNINYDYNVHVNMLQYPYSILSYHPFIEEERLDTDEENNYDHNGINNHPNEIDDVKEGLIIELILTNTTKSIYEDYLHNIKTKDLFIQYKITLQNSSSYILIEPLCNTIMNFYYEKDASIHYFNRYKSGDDDHHIRHSMGGIPQQIPIGFMFTYNHKYNIIQNECPSTLGNILSQSKLDHTIYHNYKSNKNKSKYSKRFIDDINNSNNNENINNNQNILLPKNSLFISIPMPILWLNLDAKEWIHVHAEIFQLKEINKLITTSSSSSSSSSTTPINKTIIINNWIVDHSKNNDKTNLSKLIVNHSLSICNNTTTVTTTATNNRHHHIVCSDYMVVQKLLCISSLFPWGRNIESHVSQEKTSTSIQDTVESKMIIDTQTIASNNDSIVNNITDIINLNHTNTLLLNTTHDYSNTSIVEEEDILLINNNSRIRRRLEDTYAASLIHVNRIYNKEFGTDNRKVPAHLPHMIDKDYIYEMQSKWPEQWNTTSSNRFRSPIDMQYSFSYYYYLINRNKAVSHNISNYIENTIDTDNDGIINNNEFATLSSIMKGSDDPIPSVEDLEQLKVCILSSSTYGKKYVINYLQTYYTHEEINLLFHDLFNASFIKDIYIYKTQDIPLNFTIFLQKNPKPIQLFPTISEVMNCSDVIIGINKNVNWNLYLPTHSIESDKDIVAFEMIGDDYNTTLKQLYSVRARQSKFICINDNMKNPSKELDIVLNSFYESFFPIPSIFELPKGNYNPTLYLDQYQNFKKYDYANNFAQYIILIFKEQNLIFFENHDIHFLLFITTFGLVGLILFKYLSLKSKQINK